MEIKALVKMRLCDEGSLLIIWADICANFDIPAQVTTKTERGHSVFNANWPCVYGAEPVAAGPSCSRKAIFASPLRPARACEWKWICGLRLLKKPCVVYSFGSHNETSFEQGLRRVKPDARCGAAARE